VTAIGNGETLPISLLRWEDRQGYTYSPVPASGPSDPAAEDDRKLNVGRGLYNENAVVVVIVLSLLLSIFSVLIVSQYRRSRKKKATDRISVLLGDTASPAYWSEGRLFLLCCCASLLAFYLVVAVDFCLPLIAGREVGRSVQMTLTPKVAIFLFLVTTLLLLLAIAELVAALRAAPAGQKGSAVEVTLFALLGCTLVFVLDGFLVVSWYETVKRYPASGLFSFLRSFDLRGGLSPLLPLSCVATAACLWAMCSFRRLRLIDVLRASGTVEKNDPWLSFLSLEGRSFAGVRELENNIKHNLESASVISVQGYTALLAAAFLAGYYFFDTRLVRALEARPFYWIFEVAFFIVYWALFMEFIRLVLAWRGLHLLLQRLSWHPLHAAFKRYHQRFPSHAKMNLTQPPSTFAALESSVEQAARLLRTARAMVPAADTASDLRELLQQSIPEWEAQVQAAEAELYEALTLQWTDPSQMEGHPLRELARKKHRGRLKGDWRQSLRARRCAHHALFQLMQSLTKPMEQHWFSGHAEGAVPAETAFFQQVEEFIVSRVVNFLAIVFPSLQNLGYFVLVGLLLMLLAVTSYPFQPRNEFLFFNWVVILSFIGTVFWIFVQMGRDTVLSLLNGTKPGQVNFNRELVLRTFLYIGAPLLALFGAQFPESLGKILSVFTAAQGTP
jgi:ABC-type multidrug transport system fused ATPase/permease subunit